MTTRTETMRLWQEGSQQELLDHTAALLGLGPEEAGSPDDFPDMADQFGNPLPLSLRAFLVRDELAHAVCSRYTLIPPLLELADKDSFPGLQGRPVVNISTEEQGVCL